MLVSHKDKGGEEQGRVPYHSVAVFVWMVCFCVVASMPVLVWRIALERRGYVLVTGKDFSATAESEPSITLSVMSTSSAAGKFLTSDDTQVFTDLFMVFRMTRYT